jgi:hypothetical protein
VTEEKKESVIISLNLKLEKGTLSSPSILLFSFMWMLACKVITINNARTNNALGSAITALSYNRRDAVRSPERFQLPSTTAQ